MKEERYKKILGRQQSANSEYMRHLARMHTAHKQVQNERATRLAQEKLKGTHESATPKTHQVTLGMDGVGVQAVVGPLMSNPRRQWPRAREVLECETSQGSATLPQPGPLSTNQGLPRGDAATAADKDAVQEHQDRHANQAQMGGYFAIAPPGIKPAAPRHRFPRADVGGRGTPAAGRDAGEDGALVPELSVGSVRSETGRERQGPGRRGVFEGVASPRPPRLVGPKHVPAGAGGGGMREGEGEREGEGGSEEDELFETAGSSPQWRMYGFRQSVRHLGAVEGIASGIRRTSKPNQSGSATLGSVREPSGDEDGAEAEGGPRGGAADGEGGATAAGATERGGRLVRRLRPGGESVDAVEGSPTGVRRQAKVVPRVRSGEEGEHELTGGEGAGEGPGDGEGDGEARAGGAMTEQDKVINKSNEKGTAHLCRGTLFHERVQRRAPSFLHLSALETNPQPLRPPSAAPARKGANHGCDARPEAGHPPARAARRSC